MRGTCDPPESRCNLEARTELKALISDRARDHSLMVVGWANIETSERPRQKSLGTEVISFRHGALPNGRQVPTRAPDWLM